MKIKTGEGWKLRQERDENEGRRGMKKLEGGENVGRRGMKIKTGEGWKWRLERVENEGRREMNIKAGEWRKFRQDRDEN